MGNCKKRQAMAAAEQAAAEAHSSLDEIVSQLGPKVEQVKDRTVDLYTTKVAPFVKDRVQSAVSNAYQNVSDRVENDVLPRLQEAWDKAQQNPQVHDATRRGSAAIAALRGENYLPEPVPAKPKRHIGRNIFVGLGIMALIAAIAVAVKTILGAKDDGWTPQEPARPFEATDDLAWCDSPLEESKDEAVAAEPDVDTHAAQTVEQAEAQMTDEGGPTTQAPAGYGEGSYVGANPPGGYTIKGNERSMKYHVVDSAGYERTIADVWFNTQAAAEAAGFTRASR